MLCVCGLNLCVLARHCGKHLILRQRSSEKSLPPDGEDMGGYIQINKQTNNSSLRKYLSRKEILNNLSWCCSSLPLFNILSCCHLRGEENNLANWEPLWSPKKIPFLVNFRFHILPVSEHKSSKANTFQFAICVFLHFFSVRLSPEARWSMKIMEKTDIGIVFQNPEPFLL